MNQVVILQGNCIQTLKGLPAGSVQTCVSSPPYYGLRDYGTAQWEGGDPECDHAHKRGGNGAASKKQTTSEGTQDYQYKDHCPKCGAIRIDEQIGMEATPELYIQHLVEVYREVWRVLKDDGTIWVNIGDSYNSIGHKKSSSGYGTTGLAGGKAQSHTPLRRESGWKGAKHKDLIGIPWMLAFALRADGWYLRRDIIWSKSNPMPESVDDRPTTAHEYIFLLSKRPRYYYDNEAIKEPAKGDQTNGGNTSWRGERTIPAEKRKNGQHKNLQPDGQNPNSMHIARAEGEPEKQYSKKNKRSVWEVATKPYKEAHFATYPEDLIEPCILAGTSERGECPTCGTAWERVIEHHLVPTDKAAKTFVIDERDINADAQDQGSNRQKDGHKPGYISADVTLGWRPSCSCYGLPIIGDQPSQPSDPKKQKAYEKTITAWRAQWEELKPQYDQCETVPQTVLDPFNGSGTTGAVSIKHRRKYVGCELKADYIKLTERRLGKVQPVLI
jgi:DNA modification methylase